MTRSLAVLLISMCAAASPSPESLKSGSEMRIPVIAAFHASRPRPPLNGSISGTINGVEARLNIDRRGGKITGALEQQEVKLFLLGNGDKITGSAFGAPVDVLETNPGDGTRTFEGHVRQQGFKFTFHESDHFVKGAIAGRGFRISYDYETGIAKGGAGGAAVNLTLDKISGRLGDALGFQKVDLTLTNEDLGSFLEHLYLFIK